MEPSKLKRWLIVQKVTLGRGYQWANTPMVGVMFVGIVRMAFPTLVDRWWKFVLFTVLGMAVIYILGWLDTRLRLFHEENDYLVEVSPHVEEHLKNAREKP